MSIYAVRKGRQTGLFRTWGETQTQVSGFSGAEHKKFNSKEEALRWLNVKRPGETKEEDDDEKPEPPKKKVCIQSEKMTVIYCDGSCLGNGTSKARGGVGVWFGHDNERNLSESLPKHVGTPTNQKAELWAAIRALEQLEPDEPALLWTDSQYALKSATEWRYRWIARHWQVELTNLSLHRQLSDLMDRRIGIETEWRHVYGHTNVEGNEAADKLAKAGVQ